MLEQKLTADEMLRELEIENFFEKKVVTCDYHKTVVSFVEYMGQW